MERQAKRRPTGSCQKGKGLSICQLADSRRFGKGSDDSLPGKNRHIWEGSRTLLRGFMEATCGPWVPWMSVQSCLCCRKKSCKEDLRCEVKLQFLNTFFFFSVWPQQFMLAAVSTHLTLDVNLIARSHGSYSVLVLLQRTTSSSALKSGVA